MISSSIEIIDGEQYVKIELLDDEIKQKLLLEKENQKYKEVINKLREDLNLLIKYGDGEDASRWDKQYGEFAKNHLKYMDELLKEVK